jgi:16S rRNA (guanine966-N2)-methyltransferase
MRIVSGHLGGRKLEVPKGRDIRPTGDKIRGAMFNALRSRGAVEGTQVLDAFCGTGALGLEALSQGAKECTFMDKSPDSLALAKRNAENMRVLGEVRFIRKEAKKTGARPEDIPPAGLVFLDPPYAKGLIVPALEALYASGWIAQGAWVVCESEKAFNGALPTFCTLDHEKTYGDTKVIFAKTS